MFKVLFGYFGKEVQESGMVAAVQRICGSISNCSKQCLCDGKSGVQDHVFVVTENGVTTNWVRQHSLVQGTDDHFASETKNSSDKAIRFCPSGSFVLGLITPSCPVSHPEDCGWGTWLPSRRAAHV